VKGFKLALLAVVLVGCGGIVNYKDEGGGSADGGSSPTGPGNGGGTSGPSAIKPTILGVQLTADCAPVVGPDPIIGNVIVNYENGGIGAGSMNITSADVTFANAMEGWVFAINLNPTTSGTIDAGTQHATQHDKVATAGDASFVCNFCGLQGDLNLRFLDDQGDESQAGSAFTLLCAL
jgi:hypothetical protein